MVREWLTLGYGCSGALFCLVANLLVFRTKLAGKRLKLGLWQRWHLWLSLLSVPCVLCHCGFDSGWAWGVGRWLWLVYWTIIGTGIVALVAHQLGPLVKFGQGGKAQTAARWIGLLKELALFIHQPLSGALWPLLVLHLFAKLFY